MVLIKSVAETSVFLRIPQLSACVKLRHKNQLESIPMRRFHSWSRVIFVTNRLDLRAPPGVRGTWKAQCICADTVTLHTSLV